MAPSWLLLRQRCLRPLDIYFFAGVAWKNVPLHVSSGGRLNVCQPARWTGRAASDLARLFLWEKKKKNDQCWMLVCVCVCVYMCVFCVTDDAEQKALCRSGRKQDVRGATLCRTKSNSDTAAVSFLSMRRSCSTAAAPGATPPTALLICCESISRVISVEMNVDESASSSRPFASGLSLSFSAM